MNNGKTGNFQHESTIRIIILIEENVRFNEAYFGLYDFIQLTLGSMSKWTHCVFFPATRSDLNLDWPFSESIRVIKKFRFKDEQNTLLWDVDCDELSQLIERIDQVWLFGFSVNERSLLTKEEGSWIFNNVMNTGKGVFAVGDHETIGAPMCRNVPRVRHMRYWNRKTPDINLGSRNSSIEPDPYPKESPLYVYLESDYKPAKIKVRKYQNYQNPNPFENKESRRDGFFGSRPILLPHPLLSSSDTRSGAVDVLPDHAHDGEVVVLTKEKWEDLLENEHYPEDTDVHKVEDEWPRDIGRIVVRVVSRFLGESIARSFWIYMLEKNDVNNLFEQLNPGFHRTLLDDYVIGGIIVNLLKGKYYTCQSIDQIIRRCMDGAKHGLKIYLQRANEYSDLQNPGGQG